MDKKPSPPNLSPSENRSSRTIFWTIFGILLGFSLPLIACMALFFIFIVGTGTIAGQGAAPNTPGIPIHVSGPLTGSAIALIEINGQIISGKSDTFSSTGMAASEDIILQIKSASQDPDVKALLLKINTPGGSVVGADEIYQALIKTELPIVVAMGEITASGGYYISMAGDHLFANPNSLVGSIGVISTIPNAVELIDKIGVEFNVFTSGDSKDFGSLYREMTEEEITYWQSVIDETYGRFVQIVADGRKLTREEVLNFADGRVYTGQTALELGMIDELGYDEDAIEKATILAGIPGTPRIIQFPSNSGIFSLLGLFTNPVSPAAAQETLERLISPGIELRWTP